LPLLLALLAWVVPAIALAQEAECSVSWTNTRGGNWDTASNWSTGKVPTELDTVCLPGANYTVQLRKSIDVHGISIAN